MTKPVLSSQDFVLCAQLLGCKVAAVKAVAQVESPRGGFNPDDTPTTLFEAHQFYKYANKAKRDEWLRTNPNVISKSWNKTLYKGNWEGEQKRLQEAMSLDRNAALMSASWGRFQIMGFNFTLVGFTTVQQFVNAMYKSEGAQLEAFCQYVIHNHLADELQRKDWAGFAKGYNGSEYFKNDYDGKLSRAYLKFSKE